MRILSESSLKKFTEYDENPLHKQRREKTGDIYFWSGILVIDKIQFRYKMSFDASKGRLVPHSIDREYDVTFKIHKDIKLLSFLKSIWN